MGISRWKDQNREKHHKKHCDVKFKEEMQCKVEIGFQVEHTVYEYDFGIVHLTTFYCKLLMEDRLNGAFFNEMVSTR